MDSKYLVYLFAGRVFLKRVIERVNTHIQYLQSCTSINENQTYYAYRKQLSNKEKRLCGVWLACGYVLAVTLTTKEMMEVSELNKKFKKLIESLRGVDSTTAYIKGVDCFKKGKRYHLHVLLQFPNGIPKVKGKLLGKWWFVKHWPWSDSRSLDVKKAYKPYGWLDYILNPKKDNVIDIEACGEDKLYVKFKKYTRIITFSKNLVFEEPIEVFECEKGEVFDLVNHYIEELGGIDDVFKKAVYSKWVDEHNKERKNLMYCHIHP